MGRYERMICYLYEYQDGHKGANVGYVKLEKRGEQCRVLIQMRRADLATLPQAALFQQEKTGVLLIPIGVMRDNNGSMKGQYEGNVDNLAGTGLSLDDVHGVLVYVEEGHYFASTWNLEQIDARQLRWWQGDQHEDAGKAEALPEGGSETSQDMVVSSDSSNETPQNMVISSDSSNGTPQNMVISSDSSNETSQNMVVSSDSSNEAPQNMDVSADSSSEAPQKEVASSERGINTPRKEVVSSGSGSNIAQRFADHLASAQAGISRKPENASMERCSRSAEVTGQSICGSCPFQRKELDYGKKMLLTFPVMRPFGERYPGQCVRIEPQDIGCLPMRMWSLSGNPFLMQGYFQYRHLIFMEWEKGYVIGVPGIYSNMMQSKAENAGFREFIAICGQKNCRGAFGYWLMPLD
ncbi:hypothetical protein DXB73_12145 [Clostridium sp. OM05-6BH]|uniref:DUF6128 domain-containing protein n=1 Tax=unclassified Clostridium TaxID=2614128 RepID=UPI000E5256B5|nr:MULTISPECIES: DUF6128 domain-containing protein [unclassified Clostridium]RHV10730.1 hypothetical protein DXB78_12205 [Clostridium sp. OM05-9BH]RHV17061.1 hypothetical protein DXB73_12145 [Clostridium sp. OM05-6BH]